MQNVKRNLTLIVSIAFILVAFIFALLFTFIRSNTSFLTFNVPKEEVAENNTNSPSQSEDQQTYTELITQELNVPQEFKTGVFSEARRLNLPEDFTISVYAAGFVAPRFMDFTPANSLVVTDLKAGKVLMVQDRDSDGVGETILEIDAGLRNPHGIDYYAGDLYVAEETQVVVYRNLREDGAYSRKDVLVSNLPVGGHSTRTVVVGPDEKLYLSIGSSCNVCDESDERRAAIMRYDLDGSNGQLYASGLRNTVGFVFKNHGYSAFDMWGVDMGRDLIGDDLPPEEVNIIAEGKNYGWPKCYGQGIVNPEYASFSDFCANETEKPIYEMQAHSAPLGLTFIPDQSTWPLAFSNNLFIGFHGSWNRSVPTGYKVVRIDTGDAEAQTVNFVTGWLEESGRAWGRPVDVKFDANGVMYITDDGAGAIYRVEYSDSL